MANKKVIWAAAIAFIAAIAIFLPGFSRYHQLKARQSRLNDGIEKLRASQAGLSKEQGKLQNDPTYIEKRAREKLQIANKGETIVRVEDKDAK